MKLLERFTPEQLHDAIDQAEAEKDHQALADIDRLLEAELHDWTNWARPTQLAPDGDWLIWLLVTGRRWGKTRTAAEWLRVQSLQTVGAYGICAPTYADVRDVCVEQGTRHEPSGFVSVCAPGEIKNYNRSLGEIRMSNGSRIKMLSADEPDRARGWGFRSVWCDEFSSWRRPATWDETLLPATTMADRHRFVITTTPKRNELTRRILAEAEREPETIRLVRGHTIDNAANLGAGVVDDLRRRMSARLARQELEGEFLEDVDGAIWTRALLDARRVSAFPDLSRLVIAVDPAVTSGENADDTGIIVAGRNGESAYVLEDQTCHLPPTEAMARAVTLYHELSADAVVIEANNGGDYLPALLHSIDPSVKVQTVRATRGKLTRAEPVQGLMENGRVWLVNRPGESFPELEDQLTSWVPGDPSPDRLDAFVWGVTSLFPDLAAGEGRTLRYRR